MVAAASFEIAVGCCHRPPLSSVVAVRRAVADGLFVIMAATAVSAAHDLAATCAAATRGCFLGRRTVG